MIEEAGRGHRFETDSDTEVVLHAYLEWGPALAERLNGMYAFAIWDGRTNTLVMVRDRMGIKPFYYAPTADGVLFGSEPKAILANPMIEPTVTLDGFRELFGFVKTPGHAVWDGMREVKPGTVVTVGRTGLRTTRYWTLATREHTDDQDTTVARVRELLDDIVARQLVADVPRCTLLSGGLDSSAMTAIAARQLDEPVRTFAVDFAGQAEHFVPDELRPTGRDPRRAADVGGRAGEVAVSIHTAKFLGSDPQTPGDPTYGTKLQEHACDVLASQDHPVFELIDRGWLRSAAAAEDVDRPTRFGLERTLDLALWLDMYKPVLKLS